MVNTFGYYTVGQGFNSRAHWDFSGYGNISIQIKYYPLAIPRGAY
jgi:hypothetical protein